MSSHKRRNYLVANESDDDTSVIRSKRKSRLTSSSPKPK